VSWTAGLSSSAIRDLDRIPPRVVPAVLEFIYGPLTENPRRLGKPLRDDFAGECSARRGSYRILYRLDDARHLIVGEWSARRGSYRILYRLDDARHLITVSRVNHRAHAYRRR